MTEQQISELDKAKNMLHIFRNQAYFAQQEYNAAVTRLNEANIQVQLANQQIKRIIMIDKMQQLDALKNEYNSIIQKRVILIQKRDDIENQINELDIKRGEVLRKMAEEIKTVLLPKGEYNE